MRDDKKKRRRWYPTYSFWPRGVVVGFAFHIHTGRHKGIKGFDATLNLVCVSLHLGYRHYPENTTDADP